MANLDVRVRGVKKARRNLRQLISEMAAEKQVDAVEAGAKHLAGAAAARAPIGAGAPTRGGRHLKDAIETDVRDETENKVKVAVGPAEEQFHGVFFELGTLDMPPDPFLRPAFDSEGDRAVRIARRKLARETVETTTRLNRGSG